MKQPLEHRTFQCEFRVFDDEERTVEGVVVPWNERTDLIPGGERFLRGSLDRTVQERGLSHVKLFVNHDHKTAVGKPILWNPGHRAGLLGKFRMFDTPAGDAAYQEIREGALDQFSVGFFVIEDRRGKDGAREIVQARLQEISLTPMAAYDGAQVLAVRTPAAIDIPPAPPVNLEPLPTLTRELSF